MFERTSGFCVLLAGSLRGADLTETAIDSVGKPLERATVMVFKAAKKVDRR